jgi:hypothetical protein
MSITPGIYSDIPLDAYVSDKLTPAPSLSSGLAHTLITRSPLHAWTDHCRLNPAHCAEERGIFDIGTAAHEALLQGLDRCEVIEADDWRTKAAKEARECARAAGKIPLLTKHYEPLALMVETAKAYIAGSELAGLFDDGEPEATIIWQEGPIWLRARPDWLSADRALQISYKTTSASANPESFIRGPLISMGYAFAAGFYDRGLADVAGTVPKSVFLVQETAPPFSCSLIALAPALADIASTQVERAITLWGQCMKSGKWPAYPARIAYAEPTAWMISAEEEHQYKRFTEEELAGGVPL